MRNPVEIKCVEFLSDPVPRHVSLSRASANVADDAGEEREKERTTMFAIRPVRTAVLAVVMAAAGMLSLAAPAAARADDTFAAIAYSESTNRYGYSYGYDSRAGAEDRAITECKADDAKIVVWGRNAYVALAVSDEGAYGYAWASTEGQAKRLALQKCRDFGGNTARVAVCVFSGD